MGRISRLKSILAGPLAGVLAEIDAAPASPGARPIKASAPQRRRRGRILPPECVRGRSAPVPGRRDVEWPMGWVDSSRPELRTLLRPGTGALRLQAMRLHSESPH